MLNIYLLVVSILPKTVLGDCYECAKCDETGYCSECNPGWDFRDPNSNYCQQCNAKCKRCRDYNYFDCTECYDGFYLYPSISETQGECKECESELCAKCRLNSGKYECTECKPGYFVDGDNNCQQCYDTCQTCTGTGPNQCLTCKDGYYDQSSGTEREHACTNCAPLCKECHGPQITDCDVCEDGYFYGNGQCNLCNSNCATCVTTGTNCLTCHDGFYVDEETKTCKQCYEHCKACKGPNEDQCTDCFEGYVEMNGFCNECRYATSYGCPKCKKTNDGVKCTQCPPGYRVSGNAYDDDDETIDCYPCQIGNCYSCPTSSYTCERCNDHFYLESSENCAECDDICKTCEGSPSKCTDCYEHYHYDPSSNTCTECPSNCLQCDEKLACTKCNNTFYPNNDGGCTRCDESCYLCHDGTNACDECAIGYHFNEFNRCVPCPEHCERCNSTYCSVCSVDFYSKDGVCTPCADVCAHCNGPSEDDCINCDDGFYFSDMHQTCFSCNKACSACRGPSENDCTSCATGYFQNYMGCSKCEYNCRKCDSLTNCLECNDGFRRYIREGDTDYDCQPCKNRGCKKCDDSIDQCSECIDGFYPSPTDKANIYDCIKCPNDCKSCSKNQQGQMTCNDCNNGFYLDNGICKKCESPCATCTNKNTCLSCANGFLFDGTSSCSNKCSDECLTCESNPNKCTSCKAGYILSGTKCVQCFEGCKTCEEQWGEFGCMDCFDGYYIQYTMEGKRCSKCNDECATCISTDEKGCSSCAPGYFFTQMNTDPYRPYTGKCESCGKDESHCQLCIENCNDDENFNCEPVPICTKCSDGFYIDNNVCQPCDKSCGTCYGPSSDDCLTCADGLFKLENKCVDCSETCATCDVLPTNCTSCKAGQYVKDGTCVSCNLDNCAECKDDANYCTKCPGGKFVYEGKCYQSCKEAGTGLGTDLTNNECYKCTELENCLGYDDSCKCTSCKEGYFPYTDPLTNVHVCSMCKLQSCSVCTGIEINDCTECLSGFYMHIEENTGNKECRKCQAPCASCSGNDGSICTGCNDGYQLNGTVCDRESGICIEGKHCNKVNVDATEYVNYTIDLPTYTGVSYDKGGGALRVINGGFTGEGSTFDNCMSNNGGGGGIFIYNNIKDTKSTYEINLKNLVFKSCKANFGAAIYIYSSSDESPVTVESCSFTSNELIGNGDGKLSGGSAIYMVTRKGSIVDCSFRKNIGKGGAVKISVDFDVLPEGPRTLQIVAYNNNSVHNSIEISRCSFEIEENSDCSLFYSANVVVNGCTFTGNLAAGAHYIDGESHVSEIPKIYIKSCKFAADEEKALNRKIIQNGLGSQSNNSFEKNKNLYRTLMTLATLVSAAVIAIAMVVIKNKRSNDVPDSTQESMEVHDITLV